MPPLAIAAGIGAAGSIASGAMGASAAGNAADAQAQAAQQAAQLQYQAQQNALGFQQGTYGNALQAMLPYMYSGYGALANLNYLMGIPNQGYEPQYLGNIGPGGIPQIGSGLSAKPANPQGSVAGGISDLVARPGDMPHGPGPFGSSPIGPAIPGQPIPRQNLGTTQGGIKGIPMSNLVTNGMPFGSLLKPFGEQFQAPTNVTEQNDPGYQFRLQEGMKALQQSAAASGGLFTGGTGKALTQFGQDYGSNEYQNVYNRALTDYTTRFNAYNLGQSNIYNRLAALAGQGQVGTQQMGQMGLQTGNNLANILMEGAAMQGQQLNNAAAARASGYIGGANAIGGAIGGLGGNISQYLMLQQLLNQNSQPGGPYPGGI